MVTPACTSYLILFRLFLLKAMKPNWVRFAFEKGMKEDIVFPKVKGVSVAIARTVAEDGGQEWTAYVLNSNDYDIVNVLVASKGYGEMNGERTRTSILRHLIGKVEARSFAPIELVDPSVFDLVNEYWVSFYLDEPNSQIFDKKFLFVPGALLEDNITYIPLLEREGVLHG
jgi:hypothetical protein